VYLSVVYLSYACVENSSSIHSSFQGEPSLCFLIHSQHSRADDHGSHSEQTAVHSDTARKSSSTSNPSLREQFPVQESFPKETMSMCHDAEAVPATAAGLAHTDVYVYIYIYIYTDSITSC